LLSIGEGATPAERGEITDLLEESLKDVYNALTVMDRIDGGISLLLRCPGYRPPKGISLEDVTLDVYFSPRELAEGGRKVGLSIDTLIQIFGKEIALPHLKQFDVRCNVEGIRNSPA